MNEEKEIKNKIITLSGQPVSGKGTVVKALKEKLKKRGYKEEDIHVISTGNEFRNYFNKIIDLMQNFWNITELQRITETEDMKKILLTPKYRQDFINSLLSMHKNKIDFSKITIEQANNLEELRLIRSDVDTFIDDNIRKKGIEINKEEHPNEIWIIDSRLAFHNIPEAFSVRLTTNPDVAAKRVFNDKSRGEEDKYKTIEEAKVAREKRRLGEQERYKARYGVDLEDENNYDLIINTSYSTIEDISDTVLNCLDYYTQNKPFTKNWTSPKTLLPLQHERDTLSKAIYSFDELLDSIQKYGYLPNSAIEIVEVDGYPCIIEGHHRNFCSAYLGNTLVPYEILAKNDEKIPHYGSTARQRFESLNSRDLLGHEAIIAEKDSTFSYDKIYPGIYEKLKQAEEIELEH